MFACRIFLRADVSETVLASSFRSLDELRGQLESPDDFYGPTVHHLKAILYHAGILTTGGKNTSHLSQSDQAYQWAIDEEAYDLSNITRHAGSQLEQRDSHESPPDYESPGRTETTTSRIIRNTSLALELKEQYDYTCQLCGDRRQSAISTGYAECHHIRPLGGTHRGPDTAENMLVLCPTCHADFDYGMVTIDCTSHEVVHQYDSSRDGAQLTVQSSHELDDSFLAYHNEVIASCSETSS
ncbi:HNH endonuclease [Haloferax sp. ATB1]|uniref:HNH endonuclease n=1 Tax=Haloferax sp. ATB1 TaxID=1508454 RepID=UPI00373FCD1A